MEKKICTAGRSYFIVYPNGDIYRCMGHYCNRTGCLMNCKEFSKEEFLKTFTNECEEGECDAACDRDWAVKWIYNENKELIKKIESGQLESRFGKEDPKNISNSKAHIIWTPSVLCNYDCDYCKCSSSIEYTKKTIPSSFPELSDQEWIDFFKKIKKEYKYGIITLSGGEPFRKIKTLTNVIRELQDSFLFAITTNLSLPIVQFIRNIKPHNVDFNLSLHPSSTKFNFDMFLGRALLLKKSGFNVKVNFVAYPEQIYLYDKYNKIFSEYNILVELIPFAGPNRPKNVAGNTQQESDYINKRATTIARKIDVNVEYIPFKDQEKISNLNFVNFSSKCNNHCQDCHLVGQERPKDCIINEINNIDRKNDSIDLYGGEIFLRKDIFEILDEIPKNFKINIYTNGRIFNYPTYVNELKKYNIESINIPFFSLDKEKFDNFTNVEGSYHQTIKGIKNLTKLGFLVNIFIPKNEISNKTEKIKYLDINKIISYEKSDSASDNFVLCSGKKIKEKSLVWSEEMEKLDNLSKTRERKETLDYLPSIVQIGVDSPCNIKCCFCISNQGEYKNNIDPTYTEKPELGFDINKIANYLEYIDCLYLTGRGDPLLSKTFWQVIENKWNVKGIFFNTNGILLTKDNIDKILQFNGNISMGISLNAAKKETYSRITGLDKFDKVITNTKNLKNISEKIGKKINVDLTMVTIKENLEDMVPFCDIAKQIGVDKVTIQIAEFAYDYNYGWFSVKEQDIRRNNDLLEQFRYNMKIVEKKCEELGLNSHSKDASNESWTKCCKDMFDFLGIGYGGNSFSCCHVSIPTGNLNNYKTFWDLWNNKKRQEMRKLLIDGDFPEECKSQSCPYWRVKNCK